MAGGVRSRDRGPTPLAVMTMRRRGLGSGWKGRTPKVCRLEPWQNRRIKPSSPDQGGVSGGFEECAGKFRPRQTFGVSQGVSELRVGDAACFRQSRPPRCRLGAHRYQRRCGRRPDHPRRSGEHRDASAASLDQFQFAALSISERQSDKVGFSVKVIELPLADVFAQGPILARAEFSDACRRA